MRHRKPENWLAAIETKGDGIAEERALSLSEQAGEALMMGLRLGEGIDLNAMARRFALRHDQLLDPGKTALYLKQGLIWRNDGHIGLTNAGLPLLDALLGELVCAELVAA